MTPPPHLPRAKYCGTASSKATIVARQALPPPSPFVMGRAAWWMPKAALAAAQYKKHTFAEALKDFLQNVSFHCYDKLVEARRPVHERLFWIAFHLLMLGVLIVLLSDTVTFDRDFMSTSMYDPLYPINKVPFPTFSICSINRISNTSATKYAEELHRKDPFKRGVNYFYDHIKKMNWPHYQNYGSEENFSDLDLLEFENFLDIYDTTNAEVFYNTKKRMRQLTPTCDQILMRCRMANEDFDCRTKFKQTATAMGFCCTFNHDGKYSKPRPPALSFFKYKGLSLLLNVSNSDEFFKRPFSADFVFFFYSFGNYADVLSSSVAERMVGAGMHTSLSIDASIVETVKAAAILPPKARNCYFADENPRVYGKSYSFNNCITRCRMHSILVLCDCIHFGYPEFLLEVDDDAVYCTLRHWSCLKRYSFKWSNVITDREVKPGLEHEMEDALFCPQCLPPCTWTRYDVNANALPLTEYNKLTFAEVSEINVSDLALANIYFESNHVQYYRRFLKYSWIEIFSLIGSLVGMITGFSLVGICEVIYFFVHQLILSLKREMAHDRNEKNRLPKEKLLILP